MKTTTALAGLAALTAGLALFAEFPLATNAPKPLPAPAPEARPTDTSPPAPAARRTGVRRPYAAPPGRELRPEELAALRAAHAERGLAERRALLATRQRLEEEWLRGLAAEVERELLLPGGSGLRLSGILIEERDREAALWTEVEADTLRSRSRGRLEEGMRAIRSWRRSALEEAFGDEAALAVHELLERGGPGVEGEPGILARLGH